VLTENLTCRTTFTRELVEIACAAASTSLAERLIEADADADVWAVNSLTRVMPALTAVAVLVETTRNLLLKTCAETPEAAAEEAASILLLSSWT